MVGINAEGLKRHGFDAERIRAVKNAFRILFREGRKLEEAVEHLEKELAPSSADVAHMAAFVRSSQRGLARARGAG